MTVSQSLLTVISEFDEHKNPITGYLHDIRQHGRVNNEFFMSTVRSHLAEFNLSAEDRERAVRECVRVMRGEKLITR